MQRAERELCLTVQGTGIFLLSRLKPSEVNLHNAKFLDFKLKGEKYVESHSRKTLTKLTTRSLLRMAYDCVLRLVFN